jgi:hypothetical protein
MDADVMWHCMAAKSGRRAAAGPAAALLRGPARLAGQRSCREAARAPARAHVLHGRRALRARERLPARQGARLRGLPAAAGCALRCLSASTQTAIEHNSTDQPACRHYQSVVPQSRESIVQALPSSWSHHVSMDRGSRSFIPAASSVCRVAIDLSLLQGTDLATAQSSV